MNERYTIKSLLEMNGGAYLERSDYEVSRIIDNILDPNTTPKEKRKLTLVFEFTPSKDRSMFSVKFSAKSSLAPTTPLETNLYIIGGGTTGELCVMEIPPQVPGQLMLSGEEQEGPTQLKLIKSS